jgi:hypothetical protein
MPDFDFTSEISEPLMKPLALTPASNIIGPTEWRQAFIYN